MLDFVANSGEEEDYMRKVFFLATSEWEKVSFLFQDKTVAVFEMKKRANWNGADSLYDAWLLRNGEMRTWFPYDIFVERYPQWNAATLFGEITAEDNKLRGKRRQLRVAKLRGLPSTSSFTSKDKEEGTTLFQSTSQGAKDEADVSEKTTVKPFEATVQLLSQFPDVFAEDDGSESSQPTPNSPVIDATATALDEATPEDRDLFVPVCSSSDDGEPDVKPSEKFWPSNPPWKQVIVIDEERKCRVDERK